MMWEVFTIIGNCLAACFTFRFHSTCLKPMENFNKKRFTDSKTTTMFIGLIYFRKLASATSAIISSHSYSLLIENRHFPSILIKDQVGAPNTKGTVICMDFATISKE